MTAQDIAKLFEDRQGGYRFARWRRPIVPVVFGVEAATLAVVKGAIEAVVATAGHHLAETDAEMGANLFVFFFRDWSELAGVPDLDALVPGLTEQIGAFEAAGANQFRHFRFETDGAIRAAFVFLRMDDTLAGLPADDLALAQAVQVLLLWGASAFRDSSPLAGHRGQVILRPEIASLLRAAYDRTLPDAACDPSHALRLAARVSLAGQASGGLPRRAGLR